MTLFKSLPISSIVLGMVSPVTILAAIVSTGYGPKRGLPTETPTFDIVTRKFGDPLHHFEHSRDDSLQDFCLFADNFICDLVCQRQNALQPIEKN
jgi:hypothetical protein